MTIIQNSESVVYYAKSDTNEPCYICICPLSRKNTVLSFQGVQPGSLDIPPKAVQQKRWRLLRCSILRLAAWIMRQPMMKPSMIHNQVCQFVGLCLLFMLIKPETARNRTVTHRPGKYRVSLYISPQTFGLDKKNIQEKINCPKWLRESEAQTRSGLVGRVVPQPFPAATSTSCNSVVSSFLTLSLLDQQIPGILIYHCWDHASFSDEFFVELKRDALRIWFDNISSRYRTWTKERRIFYRQCIKANPDLREKIDNQGKKKAWRRKKLNIRQKRTARVCVCVQCINKFCWPEETTEANSDMHPLLYGLRIAIQVLVLIEEKKSQRSIGVGGRRVLIDDPQVRHYSAVGELSPVHGGDVCRRSVAGCDVITTGGVDAQTLE